MTNKKLLELFCDFYHTYYQGFTSEYGKYLYTYDREACIGIDDFLKELNKDKLVEKPIYGDTYFYISNVSDEDNVSESVWIDSEADAVLFKRGIYKTKELANAQL